MNQPLLKPTDRDFVDALATGLSVLQAFSEENPKLTLSDVAQIAGITRAKARRFLLTLQSLGYVKKTDRHFELAPKILQLGYTYLASNLYSDIIKKQLDWITYDLGELSSMSVLEGKDIVCTACSHPRNSFMEIKLKEGSRYPAIYTSMGRVLLSALSETELERHLETVGFTTFTPKSIGTKESFLTEIDRVRQQQYAIVDQELHVGLRSVAVPAYSHTGELLGALNITALSATVSSETIRGKYLERLQTAAAAIQSTVPEETSIIPPT